MRERGLELSAEKTVITHIDKGFDFLGQHVRKYDGKLLIKPSKQSVRNLLQKVRRMLNDNKQTSAGKLIAQLNLVLRGWAMYHRHVVSSRTFSNVDHAIFKMLWQWAKRRHPNKGRQWVKNTYFQDVGSRKWVFSGQIEGRKGEMLTIHLVQAHKIPIRRHRLIKGEANPYDPVWEAYFDQRLGANWQEHWLKRRKLIALWREQDGRCPVCHHQVTKQSGWCLYHTLPRVYGGTDTMSNLLILHPHCRERARSQKMKVTKPGAQQVP